MTRFKTNVAQRSISRNFHIGDSRTAVYHVRLHPAHSWYSTARPPRHAFKLHSAHNACCDVILVASCVGTGSHTATVPWRSALGTRTHCACYLLSYHVAAAVWILQRQPQCQDLGQSELSLVHVDVPISFQFAGTADKLSNCVRHDNRFVFTRESVSEKTKGNSLHHT
jgi:hypothetical protein